MAHKILFFQVTQMLHSLYQKNNNKQTRKQRKILTPKQLLQRLPIHLAQVKARNTSDNLLN